MAYTHHISKAKLPWKFYKSVADLLGISRSDKKIKLTVEVNSSLHNNTLNSLTYWKTIAIPTWKEFVLFLLHQDSRQHDRLWSPYSVTAAPCLVSYDYVVHTEDRQELEFFLKINNLTTSTQDLAQLSLSPLVMSDYLGQLDCEVGRELSQKLHSDFFLFDINCQSAESHFNKSRGCSLGMRDGDKLH